MNNKVCLKGLGVLGLVLLAVNCRADQMPPSSEQSTYTPPAPSLFRTNAPLRNEGVGVDVGVYGGITPFQNGQIDITSPGVPGSVRGSTKSELGEVAGIRVGYTWPDFAALSGSQATVDPDAWCMPAVEYDFFWTGVKYKADDATFGSGGNLTANLNLITMSVDPMVKFRIGPIHPYVGLGIGGTYINGGNGQVNVPGLGSASLSGSSDDICFSIAPMVGAEIFVAKHWALTAEYKYLYLVDPTLRSQATIPINYHSDGLGFQMATAGIKFYF